MVCLEKCFFSSFVCCLFVFFIVLFFFLSKRRLYEAKEEGKNEMNKTSCQWKWETFLFYGNVNQNSFVWWRWKTNKQLATETRRRLAPSQCNDQPWPFHFIKFFFFYIWRWRRRRRSGRRRSSSSRRSKCLFRFRLGINIFFFWRWKDGRLIWLEKMYLKNRTNESQWIEI